MTVRWTNILLLILAAAVIYLVFSKEDIKTETVYKPGKADTVYIKGKDSVHIDTIYIKDKSKAALDKREDCTIAETIIENDSLSGKFVSYVYPSADSVIHLIDLKAKTFEIYRTDTIKVFRIDTLQYTITKTEFDENSFIWGAFSGAAATAILIIILM